MGLGVFVGVGVGVGLAGVGVAVAEVGAAEVGATVVGAAVVGAAVLRVGDADRVIVGVAVGSGSLELLRDAHSAPAPRPNRIASSTATMIGSLDVFCSGSGSSGGPEGGICIVG